MFYNAGSFVLPPAPIVAKPFQRSRQPMSRLISFAVLIAIIVIIGLLFYKVLIGFFIPVFLAAVLVVVFRPLHRWVLEKTGQRERLAAVLTPHALAVAGELGRSVV